MVALTVAEAAPVCPERMPDFFGTLAESSGIAYSYLYLSKEDDDTNNITASSPAAKLNRGRIVPDDYGARIFAKKQNMCVDPKAIVTAVSEMLSNWCECRRANQ